MCNENYATLVKLSSTLMSLVTLFHQIMGYQIYCNREDLRSTTELCKYTRNPFILGLLYDVFDLFCNTTLDKEFQEWAALLDPLTLIRREGYFLYIYSFMES